MKENIQIVFGLLGGLAVFIYGMNMMSECLQKAAGEKMKKILSLLTRNPVMGALAGMLVTAVLQSSSATTVMAIGFVSAGLMTLPQAISIIFGANIGTTITSWILSLSGIESDNFFIQLFILRLEQFYLRDVHSIVKRKSVCGSFLFADVRPAGRRHPVTAPYLGNNGSMAGCSSRRGDYVRSIYNLPDTLQEKIFLLKDSICPERGKKKTVRVGR